MSKEPLLNTYIDNILTQQAQELTNIDKLYNKSKFDSILTAKVITSIGKKLYIIYAYIIF